MRESIMIAVLAFSVSACAFKAPSAEAVLKPTRGNTASGTLSFEQQGGSVLIKGQFAGLTPGAHGVSIHARGDCTAADASSAGGHFNPFGKRHGSPSTPNHHAGDLPMLVAGTNGKGHFQALMDGISLEDSPNGILGRSVIIHAKPDDFTTQPGGNSGPNVACGVIQAR